MLQKSQADRDRERIAELEETITQLREQIGITGAVFPSSWGLNPQQTIFLRALYKSPGGFLTTESLAHAVSRHDLIENRSVRVICHKVRKKLKPFGIEVHRRWGLGYELPKASRKIIDDILGK